MPSPRASIPAAVLRLVRGGSTSLPNRATLRSFSQRLAYFRLVWSLLLTVHEGGHALSAWWQGIPVRSVTVGMGPLMAKYRVGSSDFIVRLLPVAGVTEVSTRRPDGAATGGWQAWRTSLTTLLGGISATLMFGVAIGVIVWWRERATQRKWMFGRFVVADAVVLTVFNFLPVPPLDGGRAVLGAVAAMRGEPLAGDALFWVQAGGMALALVPMTLWTKWTSRIDRVAAHWGSARLQK